MLSLILVFVGTLAQMDDNIHGVVNRYFRSFYVWVPFQLFARFCMVFFGVDRATQIPGAFPFPGGWTLGTALLVNLLAAHLVRFKISWKRSGILLIHSGLILMMLGELFTGLFAIEGNMTIREGERSNFLEHVDHQELALVRVAEDGKDDHVVIPDTKLKPGSTISDPQLPVDVEVIRYYTNSVLGVVRNSEFARELQGTPLGGVATEINRVPDDLQQLADSGLYNQACPLPAPRSVGVAGDQSDFPSAYVVFKDKDTKKVLGTYFVSVWLPFLNVGTQRLIVDGKTYEVALRFKRTYKPYNVYLSRVKTTFYANTRKEKSYHSVVRLQDPSRGEDIDFKIYMNQPLRYQGETFYQASVRGKDTTVLQVVKNRGWLLPYVSCVVVSLGMLIHFMLSLSTFLSRRSS